MDTDCKIDDFVNVSLRIRPVLNQDSTESSCLQVISDKPPVLFVLDRTQTYHFDNIFKEEVDQETVYNATVKPLVDYVKQGYSSTVFAYGQTGTGKTYTMGTSSQVRNPNDIGVIPRALEQFFNYCYKDIETDISISFIEIYNEKVFDLLQSNKPPLTMKGFRVEGLSQEKIFSYQEAKHFLNLGNRNRHSSETKQNPNSSRSHAIFTIYCNVRHKNHETTAKLNLVDLAGCESVKKTGNQGNTFQEGVNINKGLLCIGQVMTALSTNASFIPYRQSVITTILQDSLNRKNLVSLIACVNGSPEDCNETVQTLEFAHRVKKMKNKPEVNEVVMRYKRDNPTLFHPVRTSCTPFKRLASQFQTPCLAKRTTTLPLRQVNEPSGNSIALDSPKSLSSISISSIASNTDLVPQTFSPVIKKYMAAMESSLANRIEVLIKNTLQRPSRSSLLAREKENKDKESTPSMSWNKIQNEVSKLVRTEIVQLTLKASRATSSPIDGQDGLDKIRKVLKYESPVLDSVEKEIRQSNVNICEKEHIFKVPELPIMKKKSANSIRTSSISPIEFEPRRSTRLSLKRINDNLKENSDLNLDSSYDYSDSNTSSRRGSDSRNISSSNDSRYVKRRCSERLTKKRNDLQHRYLNAIQKETNNNSLDDFDLDATNQIINSNINLPEESTKTSQPNKKRRRVTPSNKKTTTETKVAATIVKATPARKKLRENETGFDSPATAHTKDVLSLLNNGKVKQLEKLHTIGPKTAQQILLFRKIKGPLNNISDLSSMPGWHGKKFKLFLEQNFIKDELI